MRRMFATTGVLIACVSVYVLASARATYILSDGSRKSGQIVFHGDQHQSLINNVLSLGNDAGGPEFNYPIDQVGVIDFAGGQPSAAELSQLPASGHMLALRDGKVLQGTFVNMLNGDTLVWRDQSGNTTQHSLADVARIYLNPQIARTAYNYTGPSTTAARAAVGTAGQTAPAGSIQVQGNPPWTPTNITVKKGDLLVFSATGQITFGPNPGQSAGPDGNESMHRSDYPVPSLPVAALIGRVGNGTPFPIGSSTQPIVMPDSGRLMLGNNDSQAADNSGAFFVTVSKVMQ